MQEREAAGQTLTDKDIIAAADSGDLDKVRRGAEQGNAVAQTNLGLRYFYGEGFAKNEEAGNAWFHKAADKLAEIAPQMTPEQMRAASDMVKEWWSSK